MTYIVKGDKTNYKVNETLTGHKNMFDRSGKRYFTIEYTTELFYGNYYRATEMVSADYYEVAVAKAQEEMKRNDKIVNARVFDGYTRTWVAYVRR